MKIHISSSTKDALDQLGGYITEHRGSMEIKVSISYDKSDWCPSNIFSVDQLEWINHYVIDLLNKSWLDDV